MIGGDGLTPAVLKEANAALSAHGLIKIRVLGDDRAARELIYQTLANELNAAPIQHIGTNSTMFSAHVQASTPRHRPRWRCHQLLFSRNVSQTV